MCSQRTEAGGPGRGCWAALSHPADSGAGGGCLPLVLLDEEAQLGSGSAQKALHTGL